MKMKSKGEEVKKRERRSRFIVCFWPDGHATDPSAGKAPGSDSVLALIAVSKKELIPLIVQPKTKQNTATPLPESDSYRRKTRRWFHRVKMEIFGNAKGGIRSWKVQQDPRPSSDAKQSVLNESVSAVKPLEPTRKQAGSLIRKADPSLSFSSSSSSAFGRSNSYSSSRGRMDSQTPVSDSQHGKRSPSPRGKTQIPAAKSVDEWTLDPIIGLFCLLAFSLSATLIWGRGYAVLLCTLLCLCFGRRATVLSPPEGNKRSESSVNLPEIDSREYRRRVIMKGILERSRRHRAPWPAE